jgi:hypothetical protein
MEPRARFAALVVVAVTAFGLALASCGGPSSPSGTRATVLRGTVLDETTSVSAQSTAASNSAGTVTVTVRQDPSITATVGRDGTFTLANLPTGTVTLVFSRDGRELGTISIDNVMAGEQLDVTVRVRGNGVTLVDLKRITPSPSPSPSTSPSPSPSPSASPSTSPSPATCLIEGGRVGAGIELEGSVDAGTGTAGSFMLQVQGNRSAGLVSVDASGATFQCHPASGPNAPTDAQCRASVKAGARVHVSGMLQSCTTTSAAVRASKIIVQ